MKYSKYCIIFIIVMLSCCTKVFSQGGWFIKYLPTDSLNHTYLGKEIRIDFKSSKDDTLRGEINERKLLSKSDTINLEIDGQILKFSEHWRLYIDYGILKDQFLESIENCERKKIVLKEMFLISINDSSLVVEVVVGDPLNQNKKQKIVVDRSIIKGLLMNLYDD